MSQTYTILEVEDITDEFQNSTLLGKLALFKKIHVYGSVISPYFMDSEIEEYLGKKIDAGILGIEKTPIRIRSVSDKIMDFQAYTLLGLTTLCYRTRSNATYQIRFIIDELLKQVLDICPVDLETAYEKSRHAFDMAKQCVGNFGEPRRKTVKPDDFDMSRYKNFVEPVSKDLEYYRMKTETMQKKYMKPVYVYTVPIPRELKDTDYFTDMDETGVSESDVWALGMFEREQKSGNLIGILYVDKKTKLDDIREKIITIWPDTKTKNKTLIISYENIESVIDEGFD